MAQKKLKPFFLASQEARQAASHLEDQWGKPHRDIHQEPGTRRAENAAMSRDRNCGFQ